MKSKRCLGLLCALAVILSVLPVNAWAAGDFADVPPDSVYYESVSYLAQRGIIQGDKDRDYRPDDPITVQEWATMVSRAFDSGETVADPVQYNYDKGRLSASVVSDPDGQVSLLTSVLTLLHVLDIPVYDYVLYPYTVRLSRNDSILRLGRALSLCETGDTGSEIVTRGEAANQIYYVLTDHNNVLTKTLSQRISIPAGENITRYRIELSWVPASVMNAFEKNSWHFSVDRDALDRYSKQFGMTCVGITSYTNETIYVSSYSAALHEFGHFLDYTLGFPAKHEDLFKKEAASASTVMREYASSNSHEYFADFFAFWLINRDNTANMAKLQKAAPDTYAYFQQLETAGWVKK
jgi:hypothetical protein